MTSCQISREFFRNSWPMDISKAKTGMPRKISTITYGIRNTCHHHISQTLAALNHTHRPAVLKAEIRKPPHVADSNGVANECEDELRARVPLRPCIFTGSSAKLLICSTHPIFCLRMLPRDGTLRSIFTEEPDIRFDTTTDAP